MNPPGWVSTLASLPVLSLEIRFREGKVHTLAFLDRQMETSR